MVQSVFPFCGPICGCADLIFRHLNYLGVILLNTICGFCLFLKVIAINVNIKEKVTF